MRVPYHEEYEHWPTQPRGLRPAADRLPQRLGLRPAPARADPAVTAVTAPLEAATRHQAAPAAIARAEAPAAIPRVGAATAVEATAQDAATAAVDAKRKSP